MNRALLGPEQRQRNRQPRCPYVRVRVTYRRPDMRREASHSFMTAGNRGKIRVSSGSITELRQDDYFYNRQIVKLDDVTHLATS